MQQRFRIKYYNSNLWDLWKNHCNIIKLIWIPGHVGITDTNNKYNTNTIQITFRLSNKEHKKQIKTN